VSPAIASYAGTNGYRRRSVVLLGDADLVVERLCASDEPVREHDVVRLVGEVDPVPQSPVGGADDDGDHARQHDLLGVVGGQAQVWFCSPVRACSAPLALSAKARWTTPGRATDSRSIPSWPAVTQPALACQ